MTSLSLVTNPNTLGPRIIEKIGLVKCILINVEAPQGTYKYHYECMNIIMSGVQVLPRCGLKGIRISESLLNNAFTS